MPRYFFHSADGTRDPDLEGTELPNIETAREQAIVYAGETLKFKPELIWAKGQWRVEVTDEQQRLLFTLITVAVDAPKLG